MTRKLLPAANYLAHAVSASLALNKSLCSLPSKYRSTAVRREDSLALMVTGTFQIANKWARSYQNPQVHISSEEKVHKVCLGHSRLLTVSLPLLENNRDPY